MKKFSSLLLIAIALFLSREASAIPGDLNGDNVVNALDLRLLQMRRLGLNAPTMQDPDLNGDGTPDTTDFALLAAGISGQTAIFRVVPSMTNPGQLEIIGLNLSLNPGTDSLTIGGMMIDLSGASTTDETDGNNQTVTTGIRFTIPPTVPDGGNGVLEINGVTVQLPPVRVPVQVSLGSISMSSEGSNATIAINLDKSAIDPVTVTLETTPGTASTQDFTPFSGTVTIPAGTQTVMHTIALADDEAIEGTEAFSITLSNPARQISGQADSAGMSLGTSSGNVEITDTDLATLAFTSSAITVPEGAPQESTDIGLNVQLQLNNKTLETSVSATVAIGTLGAGAVNGTDFSSFTSTTITFQAGAQDMSVMPVSISVLGDDSSEGDETFSLDLTTSRDSQAQAGTISTATITIQDDDVAQNTAPMFTGPTSPFVRSYQDLGIVQINSFQFLTQIQDAEGGQMTLRVQAPAGFTVTSLGVPNFFTIDSGANSNDVVFSGTPAGFGSANITVQQAGPMVPDQDFSVTLTVTDSGGMSDSLRFNTEPLLVPSITGPTALTINTSEVPLAFRMAFSNLTPTGNAIQMSISGDSPYGLQFTGAMISGTLNVGDTLTINDLTEQDLSNLIRSLTLVSTNQMTPAGNVSITLRLTNSHNQNSQPYTFTVAISDQN